MMSYWFLALLLALVENTWSLPLEMDQAMMVLAESDSDVTNFFHYLGTNNFTQLPVLYARMIKAGPKLNAAQDALDRSAIDKSLKPLKRLLDIELEKVIFKIQEIINRNEDVVIPLKASRHRGLTHAVQLSDKSDLHVNPSQSRKHKYRHISDNKVLRGGGGNA